jgi:hypothetical protein
MTVLIALGINYLIGCGVCAAVDSEDHRLLQWAKDCPLWGGSIWVASCWPVILYFWVKERGK